MQAETEKCWIPTHRSWKQTPTHAKSWGYATMQPRMDWRQLKSLPGIKIYYRDMREKRNHVLAPLHDLVGSQKNKNWRWIEIEQAAFDDAKEILAQETIMNYPDFSKPFVIHSDANEVQRGAVLFKGKKT